MRVALLAFVCLATPAIGWEFTPTPVCTLRDDGPLNVEVTFDPRNPEPYAITVTGDAVWPVGPVFAIRFDGPRGGTITTTRHRRSTDGRRLTVTDRGFGNVLDGIAFNDTATVLIGETAVSVPLAGARGPVAAFRACTSAPVA